MALPVTTGLQAHLDPSALGAAEGATITSAPAVGGTTAWTVQGTGPIYRASGINGQPYLEQTAAGGTGLRWSQSLATVESTVFVVAKMRPGGTKSRILSGLNNNWLLGWHGNTEDDFHAVGWVFNSDLPASDNLIVYSANRSASGYHGFRRGNKKLAVNNLGAEGPNGLTTNGHQGGNEFSDADVYEVIVYDRPLTDLEFRQVNAYLAKRYFAAVRNPYVDRVLDDGPCALWRFEETSGTAVADSSTGAFHGSLANANLTLAAASLLPVSESAIEVTAASAQMNVPPRTWPDGNEISIELWVEMTDTGRSSTTMDIGHSTEGRQINIHLPWSNDNVYWDCGGDAGTYNRINKAMVAAEITGRHHWVFTKNAATGVMRIYLDGALWHEGTAMTRTIKATDSASTLAFQNPENGRYDEMAIYPVELTATQILDHYNIGINQPPSSPVLTSPNGGEIFSATHDIVWNEGTDPEGGTLYYDIEISTDGGNTWRRIATEYRESGGIIMF